MGRNEEEAEARERYEQACYEEAEYHRTIEEEIAAARREGVIEGLERALELLLGESGWRPSTIRAELERLREEKP